MSSDSFGARSTLEVGGRSYEIFRLDALAERFDVARLPYSIKVLLENVLRLEDGVSVSADDVEAIAGWDAAAEPSVEIPFQPARVLMQDFTGVPAVVDLAAMRDAMAEIGGDPEKINPLVDVDLVIDHSVQVDAFGNERAFAVNAEREFERNRERYSFLKWGREAFDNFSVVPPATGICHQVNLEHISQVVYSREQRRRPAGLPRHAGRHRLPHDDGQRARRARLGRRRDRGRGGDARPADLDAAAAGASASSSAASCPRASTATDLVLTVTEMLRERGVVSKFVEFYGPGLPTLGPGRPGDARQHVAGVRLDLRDLPGRRRDPPLPGADRPPDRDARAGRRLRPRAGHVPDDGLAPTRPSPTPLELDLGDVAPEHRRAETPPGPGAARRGQGGLPRGDGGVRPRGRRSRWATAATRRSKSPSRPPTRRPRTTTTSAASRGPAISRRRRRRRRQRAATTRSRSRSRTARPSSSTTAGS